MKKLPNFVATELQILQDFYLHIKNNKNHMVPHVTNNILVLKLMNINENGKITFNIIFKFT